MTLFSRPGTAITRSVQFNLNSSQGLQFLSLLNHEKQKEKRPFLRRCLAKQGVKWQNLNHVGFIYKYINF